jgi:ferredoxin
VIPGTEFLVAADKVLAAVGQEADMDFLRTEEEKALADWGRIPVDPLTEMTGIEGVFASGDVVTGPSTVVEAIGGGHRSAAAIARYLKGGVEALNQVLPAKPVPREYEVPDTRPIAAKRHHHEVLLPEPGKEFIEVEQAFSGAKAVAEARRCLRCGPCGDCRICAPTCQRRQVYLRVPGEGEGAGATAVIRAPGSVAMDMADDRATPAWLLDEIRPGTLRDFEDSEKTTVEILPMRAWIDETKCRGCGECVDVCQFGAIELEEPAVGPPVARVESALCRGCNLCTAVCDTHAAMATALGTDWWRARLDFIFAEKGRAPRVVLACQRRAGALEAAGDMPTPEIDVVRFRCAGQVKAGMLLDLLNRGAAAVAVAACETHLCRFGKGTEMASEEIAKARKVFSLLGGDASKLTLDMSGGRLEEAAKA